MLKKLGFTQFFEHKAHYVYFILLGTGWGRLVHCIMERSQAIKFNRKGKTMQRKKTFSTMEIVLLIILIGSLIISFLQARREEEE